MAELTDNQHIVLAEQTLHIIDTTLSNMPHKVVGSFSGDKSRFGPQSDLDIAVRAVDFKGTVALLKAALKVNRIGDPNYKGNPPYGRPGGTDRTLFSEAYTPVNVINSL